MTQQDIQTSEELAQERKEVRYERAQLAGEIKAARSDVATFQGDVSGGRPGARLDLAEAKKRLEELESQGERLDARELQLIEQRGALGKWEIQSQSLASAHQLTTGQQEQLFEAFRAGKNRAEVEKIAQRLKRERETSARATNTASFARPDDVAW